MSCFPGLFSSLPGVSCDRFSGANLQSDQFFLSHCHADHMVGLDQLVLRLRALNTVRVNHRIYCSAISKAFLVRKFPCLDERFVTELFPDAAATVNVYDGANQSIYKLRVTAITAQHCPGSVMFLFETLDEVGTKATRRILYTGDFRFEALELSSLRSLHANASPLCLDELFLDTTFCHPQYDTFPTRRAAQARIWEIVNDWVRKNGVYRNQRAKHVVLLHLPAQYGSEAILHDIYEKSCLKWRIHVSDNKFQDYLCSDELGDCTDADPRRAQWVHACSWKDQKRRDGDEGNGGTGSGQKLPCQQGPFKVCNIRPSAMHFTQERMKDREDKVVQGIGPHWFRVCYSCHSSFSELKEFVHYFKPKKLIPCVIPSGYTTIQEVTKVFEPILGPGSIDLTDSPLLGDLGAYSPVHLSLSQEADFLKSFCSPEKSRKRRNVSPNEGGRTAAETAKKPLVIVELANAARPQKAAAGCDSSEDDDDDVFALSSRRRSYQRSKSRGTNYSMPVASSTPSRSTSIVQNRGASLPHNTKIPEITITPSSPSPDPNHPDYPDFFQARLYLETKKMSTSTESGGGGGGGGGGQNTSRDGAGNRMETMETDILVRL